MGSGPRPSSPRIHERRENRSFTLFHEPLALSRTRSFHRYGKDPRDLSMMISLARSSAMPSSTALACSSSLNAPVVYGVEQRRIGLLHSIDELDTSKHLGQWIMDATSWTPEPHNGIVSHSVSSFSFFVEGKSSPKGRIRRSFPSLHTQLSTIARSD